MSYLAHGEPMAGLDGTPRRKRALGEIRQEGHRVSHYLDDPDYRTDAGRLKRSDGDGRGLGHHRSRARGTVGQIASVLSRGLRPKTDK
jgi:hypothetical protein